MKHQTLLGVALAAGLVTGTHAQAPASGDPVLYWNQIAIQQISLDEPDPGIGGRNYAILNVAMHDAINATLGSPDRSYVGGVTITGGNTQVAAAYAAHDVLVNLYPSSKPAFDAALTASTAGLISPSGMATGQSYASAMLALRANDGYYSAPPAYVPTGAPGNYVPTVITPNGPIVVGTQQATAAPFILASDSQFRVGPPPALASTAYTAAYDEVKSIGALNSLTRTADQTTSALFWAPNPETPYLTAAITQSLADGKSVLDNARIFATLTTGVADASPVIFDTKYLYSVWRPITAIQEGNLDGNPDTIGDPNWQSLLVAPPFPSYFSGHATVAGTAATILDYEYGSSVPFCFTNTVATRCWSSYDQAAMDDADSRLWGGIHFGYDNQLGLGVGQEIADYVIGRDVFGAVPEPNAWMTMLAGFGLVGTAMRRRPSGRRAPAV